MHSQIFLQIALIASLLYGVIAPNVLANLPKIRGITYHKNMVAHNLKRAKQMPIGKSWYTNRAQQHQDVLDAYSTLKMFLRKPKSTPVPVNKAAKLNHIL